MKIDVEVISRETIKPFTTLPEDHYKFSIVEKMNPSWHLPLIYFYRIDDQKLMTSKNEISNHLKTSLSQVLSNYYPLVGNVKENFIDCKNGGVLVLEAQVKCLLSEFLQNPNPDKFVNKFLPDPDDVVLAIQLNFFSCGSIAIGVCASHKVVDASSMITFIKNWAVTAHGGTIVPPKIVGTTLFPTKDGDDSSSRNYPPEKNITSKRFVFTNSNISALKEKYVVTSKAAESSRTYPSRYKTLTCFLWSRFAASTEINKGPKRSYLLISPVNFRKMTDPPLSDDSFGIVAGSAICIVSSNDDIEEEGYNYGLVNKLTVAINKLNKDFVKKLQTEKPDFPVVWEGVDENTFKGELVYFTCSSFCRFPIYEADFGWGRPVWCAVGCVPSRNITVLIDTKNEDGIEAWVNLKKEDMAKFETDKELLTYASPISCP